MGNETTSTGGAPITSYRDHKRGVIITLPSWTQWPLPLITPCSPASVAPRRWGEGEKRRADGRSADVHFKWEKGLLYGNHSSNHRSRSDDIRGGARAGSLKFFSVQGYILHGRQTLTVTVGGHWLWGRVTARKKGFLYFVLFRWKLNFFFWKLILFQKCIQKIQEICA